MGEGRVVAPGLLLVLACMGVQAQVPVIPQDVQTRVRQRVDYGYCHSDYDVTNIGFHLMDPASAGFPYRFYRLLEP